MLEFTFNRKFSILKNLKEKKQPSLISALKRILLIFIVFDSFQILIFFFPFASWFFLSENTVCYI